jgi:hypothetical protein
MEDCTYKCGDGVNFCASSICGKSYFADVYDNEFGIGSAPALQFVGTTPCRLVDTRSSGGPIQGGTSRDFTIPQLGGCNVPSNAAAYSLNVTAVPHQPLDFLTIWPAGQGRPLVSTLNSLDGRVKASAAIVPAGAGGAVSVYVTDASDVILDLSGYFVPPSGSTLAFYALAPCRVADTRDSNYARNLGEPFLTGGVRRDFPVPNAVMNPIPCNIPDTAKAYSMNFTVVPHGSLGYLTVWPTGQDQPLVSTLNAYGGQVTANAAIVPAGAGGDISAFAYNDTDLIIDINGYFAPPGQNGALSLYPVTPCRVLDTRNGNGAFQATLSPAVDFVAAPCGIANTVQGLVVSATAVPSAALDFLTLWPDGLPRPWVSTLNSMDATITSNLAIVPTSNGKLDAYATDLTNLILDISSYFAP